MKAILMSIQSPHACNILNFIKLWEIRKKFPKDYVGWVYIYVTKGKPVLYFNNKKSFVDIGEQLPIVNGKVVARFWCDKVEKIQCNWHCDAGNCYDAETFYEHDLLEHSCLSYKELDKYLQGKNGCAIHIAKLEIFDKPKEISEFKIKKYEYNTPRYKVYTDYPLTRAPQSWCYVEV